MLEVDNTVLIKPIRLVGVVGGGAYYELKIDCEPHSSIIISDAGINPYYDNETLCEASNYYLYKYLRSIKQFRRLTNVYINVNSLLTCESFMMDSECVYIMYPFSEIIFKFNDYEIRIITCEAITTFASIIASMYAVWLAFCGHGEQMWLANVMAQPQGSDKPSIEILTKTLHWLWFSKRFNLADFDITKIPYIKDVFKNCEYKFLEDNIHLLSKAQIISIIEELGEEDGERKAMLIQATGMKDEDSGRFEL